MVHKNLTAIAVIAIIVIFVLAAKQFPSTGEAIRFSRMKLPTLADRQVFCCQYTCLPSPLDELTF